MATSAASAADGPGQHLDRQPRRHAALHEHEAGVATPAACRRRETSATTAPPRIRSTSCGRPLALVVLVVGDELGLTP